MVHYAAKRSAAEKALTIERAPLHDKNIRILKRALIEKDFHCFASFIGEVLSRNAGIWVMMFLLFGNLFNPSKSVSCPINSYM